MFKSIDTHEIDYQFHVGYNQIVLEIDEFQRSSSGWVVDHLQHLDLLAFRDAFTLVCDFLSSKCTFLYLFHTSL